VSFADSTLEGLLAQLEAPAPSPCGGATAAITAAMAGSLVAMVARAARDWEEGASVADRAGELRAELLDLAWEDTQAITGLIRFERLPEAERPAALARAVQTPSAIHDAALKIAALAELAVTHGKAGMRADADAARLLATAAAQVAAEITATNQSG